MVDVLLASPLNDESAAEVVFKGPPFLGLCSLAAVLLKRGFSVSVEDGVKPSNVTRLIEKHEPKLFGLTVSSPLARQAAKIISLAKAASADCAVVAGGPHLTAMPESVNALGADFGLTGECEETLPLLSKKILAGEKKCAGISGIVTTAGKNTRSATPSIKNLDGLPYPAFNLLDLNKYSAIPIASSRGCPFSCTYCARAAGPKVRFRSPDAVAREMEEHQLVFGAKNFSFADDVFTLDRERVASLCESISSKNLKVSWSCATRADLVDLELLCLMRDAGCNFISFGVESGVERIRFLSGKDVPDSAYEKAFSWCRKAGIPSCAHVMFGHPTEKLSDMQESVSFAKKLYPTYAVFRETVALPGTALFERAVSEGVIKEGAWTKFTKEGGALPYYVPQDLSLRQITYFRRRASRSFYLNASSIVRRVRDSGSVSELLGLPYFYYLVARFGQEIL